jgi:hypothetical protein
MKKEIIPVIAMLMKYLMMKIKYKINLKVIVLKIL